MEPWESVRGPAVESLSPRGQLPLPSGRPWSFPHPHQGCPGPGFWQHLQHISSKGKGLRGEGDLGLRSVHPWGAAHTHWESEG